jgi:hypothetical protein
MARPLLPRFTEEGVRHLSGIREANVLRVAPHLLDQLVERGHRHDGVVSDTTSQGA